MQKAAKSIEGVLTPTLNHKTVKNRELWKSKVNRLIILMTKRICSYAVTTLPSIKEIFQPEETRVCPARENMWRQSWFKLNITNHKEKTKNYCGQHFGIVPADQHPNIGYKS